MEAATPARYGTIVNIRNAADPGGETVEIAKELALAIPPGFQEQGKLLPLGGDKLEPAHALATDCDDLRKRAQGGLPEFFDGFVTVRSTGSLDVTAVYTTAATDKEGKLIGQAGIDVEPVAERAAAATGERPDLDGDQDHKSRRELPRRRWNMRHHGRRGRHEPGRRPGGARQHDAWGARPGAIGHRRPSARRPRAGRLGWRHVHDAARRQLLRSGLHGVRHR